MQKEKMFTAREIAEATKLTVNVVRYRLAMLKLTEGKRGFYTYEDVKAVVRYKPMATRTLRPAVIEDLRRMLANDGY